MSDRKDDEITKQLNDLPNADATEADQLWWLIYPELQRRAKVLLRNERADHTLRVDGLVNELYLRLQQHRAHEWKDRTHFYNMASILMRRVLIDHARRRTAEKRGGSSWMEPLEESLVEAASHDETGRIMVEELLQKLAESHERAANVFSLRVFGGLSVEEAADELGVSPRTCKADFQLARRFLEEELPES